VVVPVAAAFFSTFAQQQTGGDGGYQDHIIHEGGSAL
jgi:hypothetical protein